MNVLLRIFAVCVGLAVVLTGLSIVQFAFNGDLAALAGSGALGLTTIAAWLIILAAGPVAAIQLWRLRRTGLFATAMLCGLALVYYVVGLFLRVPDAPLRPIVGAIVVNGVLLALLLSPAAQRACLDRPS
jgi:hypothetical protein